jgi:hypothetical protein
VPQITPVVSTFSSLRTTIFKDSPLPGTFQMLTGYDERQLPQITPVVSTFSSLRTAIFTVSHSFPQQNGDGRTAL